MAPLASGTCAPANPRWSWPIPVSSTVRSATHRLGLLDWHGTALALHELVFPLEPLQLREPSAAPSRARIVSRSAPTDRCWLQAVKMARGSGPRETENSSPTVPLDYDPTVSFDAEGGALITCGPGGLLRWPLNYGTNGTFEVGSAGDLGEGRDLRHRRHQPLRQGPGRRPG